MKPKTRPTNEINRPREDNSERELSERETMLAAEENFTKTLQLMFSEQPENIRKCYIYGIPIGCLGKENIRKIKNSWGGGK